MSDFDRFTEFLRREARVYHEPPRVPAESMWCGLEGRMGEGDVVDAVGAGQRDGADVGRDAVVDREGDDQAVDVLGYNQAPAAPSAEMWGRIETAWALRDAAARAQGRAGVVPRAGGVVAGLSAKRSGAPWRWPSARRWSRQHRAAGWAAVLAAAASLVLGIALGRGAGPSQPGEVPAGPTVATVPTEAATPPVTDPQSARPTQPVEPTPEILAASVLPVPRADGDLQAAAIPNETEPPVVRVAEDTPSERTVVLPRPFRVRRDHETTRYLGRAETLLTAFRTDQRTPASERDLAEWARELFIETRMRLDLPVSRTPEELALLNDLELVLLQMSRLGSGAPDVEWQLAWESMEWKGTLPRLRAMSATDGW